MEIDLEPDTTDSEEEHLERCAKFENLDLHPSILQGIREIGFTQCTPIQSLVLPHSIRGKDVVGKAQTGTGKTAAFLLTIFQRLLEDKSFQDHPSQKNKIAMAHPKALVLAPTRELALQICNDGQLLGKYTGLKLAAIFGGIDYEKQLSVLDHNPEVIVATPGRLIDFYKQRRISLRKTRIAVIDEADRMFDMGFYPDLKFLMRKLPPFHERQTLLFSATVSYRVTELSYEFMNGPVEVDVSPQTLTAANVEEKLYHVAMEEKLPLLLGVLADPDVQRAIIFSNTKSSAKWLGFKLKGNGYPAEVLTGDISQERRLNIVRAFKDGRTKILIATDVASRGLHVDDVSHVINFDVPEDPENYVHRIGRTARAGRSGQAIMLACERYVTSLPFVEELIGHKIPAGMITDELLKRDQAGPYREVRPNQGRPQHRQGGRFPQKGRRQGHRGKKRH